MRARSMRSASMLALAMVGLGGWSASAQEVEQIQERPEAPPTTAERVVVTGTNIAGAAESAALPVEVYTADESFKQGGQTALEFTKSLSVVGSTIGETNQFQAGYANIGASRLNLRGLGGGRTLTIFNGRRFSENTNMIPSIALERTEILKDGGAVIYGADATGGVVNFITRDGFDGFLVDGEYKFVDGSDGDYGIEALWGRDFDNGNIMLSYEYSHRSELDITERDWTVRSFAENNTPWAPYHNYGSYVLRPNAFGAPFAVNVPGLGPTLGVVKDFTDEECVNSSGPVDGVSTSLGGLPVCWWNYAIHTYNLVEEIDQHRVYGQVKFDFSDSLRFTGQLAFGQSNADSIGTVASYQANVGPAPDSGTAFQFRIPSSNPYFADFLAQNASQIAAPASIIGSADQFLSIFFGPSGAPHLPPGEGTMPRTQLENWNAVAAFDGDFKDFGGDWLDTWSASLTFNHAVTDSTLPDTVGFKVQQALNGFGGPDCNAPDLVPDNFSQAALDANNDGTVSRDEWYAVIGTQNPGAAGQNGCLYLNPFSSSYPENGAFGTPNPRYIQGNDVPPELAAWLYDDRQTENANDNLTFDALVSGATPIALPGGDVAWAAGAQWRLSEGRETTSSEFIDPRAYPCAWPGQRPGDVGCAPTGQSPYFFFASDEQNRSDNQQYSYFGELQIPVLDRLSFQLAVRREEFPKSDLGATVYKIAGKWDPTDWLALRGSFGTNYQSPPSTLVPGEINNSLSLIANAGNKYLRVETETLGGIAPETAEVANFGAIFNFDNMPGNGNLRFSVDYFDFKIIDELKTVSHNSILNTTFVGARGANQLINCSSALIDRITFLNGQGASGCTQGTTVGDDVTSIRSVYGNGPGAQTSGIDYDLTYNFGAFGGDMTIGGNATNVLEYEIAAFQLNGTELTSAIDGLGFANYSREGDIVSEWRGNAYANYTYDNHNIRYVVRYIQGVTDDRFIGGPNENIDDFTTSNLYYQYTMPFDEDFTLSLSIENLTDEDPPFTVQQYSYDPFIGNPLGRTYEIGLRKQF